MYNCSYGINMWGFLTGLSNDMVSLMGPHSWAFCSMCSAYADWGSLFFMYLMCSRCLIVRVLLVWPMYDFLQVLHIRLYIPLLSLSCVVSIVLGLVLCCIVLELLKEMRTLVYLKRLVIFLILGLWYVKMAHFLLSSPFVLSNFVEVICVFVCICFSSLVMMCLGNLLLLAMSCILIHSVFLFSKDNSRAVILLIR